MYDRDIQLLQVVAAIMDPNKLLIRIIERFGLSKWAEVGFEDSPASNKSSLDSSSTTSLTPEDLSKINVYMAEEFFHLLIIILGERYQLYIGDCEEMQTLEREIIHLLCTGPKPFSKIEKVEFFSL